MATTTDGTKSNYRQFHPQATVWIQNPFDHDVIFQVADETNTPYQYKLPAHKVSELPGGAVATLGVKAIIDEMIQSSKSDVLRIWDADVRAKYEAEVVLRVKEASTLHATRGPVGEIDLGVTTDESVEDAVIEPTVEDVEFPELNDKSKNAVSDIAAASLGTTDTIIEQN